MNKVQKLIKNIPYLVWYTSNHERLSNDAIVEAVLNGGEWEDVQELIKILGIDRVAQIFKQQTARPRCNYQPKVVDYFMRYFDRYARRNIY